MAVRLSVASCSASRYVAIALRELVARSREGFRVTGRLHLELQESRARHSRSRERSQSRPTQRAGWHRQTRLLRVRHRVHARQVDPQPHFLRSLGHEPLEIRDHALNGHVLNIDLVRTGSNRRRTRRQGPMRRRGVQDVRSFALCPLPLHVLAELLGDHRRVHGCALDHRHDDRGDGGAPVPLERARPRRRQRCRSPPTSASRAVT